MKHAGKRIYYECGCAGHGKLEEIANTGDILLGSGDSVKFEFYECPSCNHLYHRISSPKDFPPGCARPSTESRLTKDEIINFSATPKGRAEIRKRYNISANFCGGTGQ